ncbi:MAG TPA: ABC transporter permease [Candidatus Acidoferrum sp.]|nr:ABC transporter permease [Candidatus Acidoferrum sp.]
MTILGQDIRYGLRTMVKNAGVTAVMVFSLALAIGANTAIFSVVDSVLLRPLPYPNPDRILKLNELNSKGGKMNFADPNFDDLRAMNKSLQAMAEYANGETTISGTSEPTRAMEALVSKDFFAVMGVAPAAGRTFAPEELRIGAAPVALVSHDFWQQSLGANQDFSQIKLKMEGKVYSVIGVMPAGFHFPDETSIWVPREQEEWMPSRTAHNWRGVGRLRDGITLSQARMDFSGIASRLKSQYGDDTMMMNVLAIPLQDSLTSGVRGTLMVLLGAVGFLLLVACANVANLLLAQASARTRELAIRAALGARRGRLVRQFLTEASLLSLTGGLLGVLVADWGVSALVSFAPPSLPRLNEVSLNSEVLLFALGVTIVVAAGLGIFTAFRATSGDVQGSLLEGGRSQSGSHSVQKLGRAVVAGQMAITLVLVIGAGLLGRSLLRVLSVDPGFRVEHIVSMDLTLPSTWSISDTAKSSARNIEFVNNLLMKLKTVPGVDDVGLVNGLPLDTDLADGTFIMMTQQEVPKNLDDFDKFFKDKSRTGDADFCVATDGYFRVLGIPLLRGRLFDEHDSIDTPHVAVINASLAKAQWPKTDPIGKTIEFGNMDGDPRLFTIVGIVGDIRQVSLEVPPTPTVYVNYRQRPRSASTFTTVMRTNGDTASIIAAAHGIVRELAPEIPPRFRTFPEIFSASLGSRSFNLTLVGAFGCTALLLAIAGVYGVMSYWVQRRTREFGVRIALGAQSRDVLGLVLRQGMLTVAIGIAAGIAGALALTRFLQSLLFGVQPTDLITFAGVTLLLTFVAFLASYIPARRATRVDPLEALRYE